MTTDDRDADYKLLEQHLGLMRYKDDCVIDNRTGRYTDAARYFYLLDEARAPTDSQAGRDAVEVLSRDPDGDISMDWQTPSGDMLSMSLSANGDFCVAVSTQRGKGTCRVLIPDLAFEVLDACLVAAGRAE